MSNQLAAAIAEITEAYRGTEHGKVAESIGDAIHQALAAHEAAKPEPACWTLTETLAAKETTCSARLWFVNPVNSAWTPLFTAPVPVASPWQPIESAPKDGEVLIYVTETDEQFVAYWDDGWRFSRNAKLKSPTHWMPLPPAPEMKP